MGLPCRWKFFPSFPHSEFGIVFCRQNFNDFWLSSCNCSTWNVATDPWNVILLCWTLSRVSCVRVCLPCLQVDFFEWVTGRNWEGSGGGRSRKLQAWRDFPKIQPKQVIFMRKLPKWESNVCVLCFDESESPSSPSPKHQPPPHQPIRRDKTRQAQGNMDWRLDDGERIFGLLADFPPPMLKISPVRKRCSFYWLGCTWLLGEDKELCGLLK